MPGHRSLRTIAAILASSAACIIPGRGQVVDLREPPVVVEDNESPETRSPASKGRSEGEKQDRSDNKRSPQELPAEPRAQDEGAFCRRIRSVTRELRVTVGRDVRCISSRYTSLGYFGHLGDLARNSFRNGCFGGSVTLESEIEVREQPLQDIRSKIVATMRVSSLGTIDLSSFGIEPGVFHLEEMRGRPWARVTLSFREPVVRSARSLGHTMAEIASAESTPQWVKRSTAMCRQHLCERPSMYTKTIVSARPELEVELIGGTAHTLTTIDPNGRARVRGSGDRFTVELPEPMNLAARFSSSEDDLRRQGACHSGAVAPKIEPPGTTRACGAILRRGLRARLLGCQRSPGFVSCSVGLTSLVDRRVHVLVDEGDQRSSSLVDDRGGRHIAQWAQVPSRGSHSHISVDLIAEGSTKVTLEFPDVGSDVDSIRRLTVALDDGRGTSFVFRNIEVSANKLPNCSGDRSPE